MKHGMSFAGSLQVGRNVFMGLCDSANDAEGVVFDSNLEKRPFDYSRARFGIKTMPQIICCPRSASARSIKAAAADQSKTPMKMETPRPIECPARATFDKTEQNGE
jgi:hypothetical protein